MPMRTHFNIIEFADACCDAHCLMFNQYETIHTGHFTFRAKRSHPLMALRVERGQSQGGLDGGSIRSSNGI